ncbi:secretion protein [Vibrio cholerae]|nr:secretion protein [Vibrio cholerae]
MKSLISETLINLANQEPEQHAENATHCESRLSSLLA